MCVNRKTTLNFRIDPKSDPLAPYRNRIIYPILILAAISLTPLFVYSFIEKRYGVGFATLVVVLSYLIDAAAIRKGKHPPIPFAFLVLPMVVAMGVSLAVQGFYGALWAYPAALACYFVLSRRMANICAVVLLFGGTAMVYRYVDIGMAMRFFGSFALTAAVANCILRVISELQRELLSQATIDPLTGAFNRRHMESRLAQMAELSGRNEAVATILMIDIDHFKRINDQLGHASGDAVLKKLSSLIREHTRKTDQLFRMGGEEFVLLLPETSAAESMTVAESIRRAIEKADWLGDYPPVTISVGVSQHELNEKSDEWIKKADKALYRAKKIGRNNVVCADNAQHA
jgi:diguanylate cyclase (GGDEF)-like protein